VAKDVSTIKAIISRSSKNNMCPPASEAAIFNPPARTTGSIPDCVPNDTISQAAYKYAAEHLHPTILNHSLRVFLYARALGRREQSPYTSRIHLLFAASILHDIGTCATHDGEQRFEVEGADAAKIFLLSHNVPEMEAHDAWIAIACHTSPGIGERISALARLVRLGVTIDFKRPAAMLFTSDDEVREVEKVFGRGEIEKVLGDVVVEQVSVRPYGHVCC
jgi:hypothetical protein